MSIIITESPTDNYRLNSRIDNYFNQFGISRTLAKCNFYKESGFSCVSILKELFSLVFTGRNLYRSLAASRSDLSFKKNTAYRFLNNGRFNWEKLLLMLMTRLILVLDQLTGKDRQSVLIADDSLFSRNRSKQVELFARIFDHTSHKFCKGFRMLTLGWSDGNTFLPVSFNLLSSTDDKNVYCQAQPKDRRTLEYKRRLRARQSTTDSLLEMILAAKDLPARFVLFDSWFTMPKTVVRIKNACREVIGMLKVTETIHYQYNGKWQNIKDIYQQFVAVGPHTAPIMGSVLIKLRESKEAEEEELVDARIVFVQDRRSNQWLALLCTDLKVSNEEIVRIYGKRWDIEVFFKVCKSHLALAKEYQGRSYDMQVAATTIVFLRYAMLATEVRNASDERTIGELFYYLKEELADIKLAQSLMLLVDALRRVLQDCPIISEQLARQIMDAFLDAIPDYVKLNLRSCA